MKRLTLAGRCLFNIANTMTAGCREYDSLNEFDRDDKMAPPIFPSPLARTALKFQNHNRTVIFPSKEGFRVRNIFIEQEYFIKKCFLPSTPITVVDIGSNVGLFALYMHMTQATDTIHCFEPAPASLELLKANTADIQNIHVHPYGLTNRNGSGLLMIHPQNSGENKMVQDSVDGPDTVEVQVRDAGNAFNRLGLAYIDVLKIDTEGCEVQILESLKPRLDYVGIIMLEYHSEDDRRHIGQLLSHFKLFGGRESKDVGTQKFINRRFLAKR